VSYDTDLIPQRDRRAGSSVMRLQYVQHFRFSLLLRAVTASCVLSSSAGCEHCDRASDILARDAHGRTVVSEFAGCTSFSTTLSDEVYLVLPSGRRELIFSYAPNSGVIVPNQPDTPLAAKWLTDGTLQISVGIVSQVDVHKASVDGVVITYKIGNIRYPQSHDGHNQCGSESDQAKRTEQISLFRPPMHSQNLNGGPTSEALV
jgi:hypothetical protein